MFGLDILRGYELSWLNTKGKPEIACLEIILEADLGKKLDTLALKEFINSLTQRQFQTTDLVNATIQEYLQVVLGIEKIQLSLIMPQDFVSEDLSLTSTALDYYISHNVRFICAQTGQPFTGSVLVDYIRDTADLNFIPRELLALRCKKTTPQEYIAELLTENCVVSVHLARKGGFSWQLIRGTDPESDFAAYIRRAAVE